MRLGTTFWFASAVLLGLVCEAGADAPPAAGPVRLERTADGLFVRGAGYEARFDAAGHLHGLRTGGTELLTTLRGPERPDPKAGDGADPFCVAGTAVTVRLPRATITAVFRADRVSLRVRNETGAEAVHYRLAPSADLVGLDAVDGEAREAEPEEQLVLRYRDGARALLRGGPLFVRRAAHRVFVDLSVAPRSERVVEFVLVQDGKSAVPIESSPGAQ